MPRKKFPNLSVGRGEKLSVKKGAGLTAKGRAKANRATGSNLKAPTKDTSNPRHKSFCAMEPENPHFARKLYRYDDCK
jgi:hypothetical protein